MGQARRRLAGIVGAAAVAAALAGCNPQVVSINVAGTDAADNRSSDPVVSPDGTKVAFTSSASDLVPPGTGAGAEGHSEVYVRDLASGTTQLVSVGNDGRAGDATSMWPVFSPDGTKVAFNSTAGNLVDIPAGADLGLFVRDLVAGTTELVSVNAAGTSGSEGSATAPTFTPDGTKVVFDASGDDLVPGDSNHATDVFVRDLVADATTLVSRNAAGTASANGYSYTPSVSPDGAKVAYTSTATDLGPADGNSRQDAYLTDLASGVTTLVSHNAAGTGAGNESSDALDFSPDGHHLAFRSWASNLGPVDSNGQSDIYLRDLQTGATRRIEVNGPIGPLEVDYPEAVFSPDSTKVAFVTRAGNLGHPDDYVCRDHNLPPRETPCQDVYVHDLVSGTTTLVSRNAAGTNGADGESFDPVFSPDSASVAFTSTAGDLGPTDTNDDGDVYVADLADGSITLVSSNEDGTDSADGRSDQPSFAADARQVVYMSHARNLGPAPDTNGTDDVYLEILPEDTIP